MILKNIFFVFIFFIFLNNFILYSDTIVVENNPKYKIEITDNKNLFEKEFDDFNFIHHLFIDIFCTLELKNITLDDKIKIINITNSYLKKNKKIDIYFKKFKLNKNLTISLYESYKLAEEGFNNFLLTTNYELKNNKLLKEKELSGDVYAKLYYIKNGLFINMHYLYDEKKEKEYKAKDNINNLADLYLFDENMSNDNQVEDLLKKEIDKNNKDIFCHFTLIEFYLSKRDFLKAKEVLNEVKTIVTEKNKKEFNWVNEEVEITEVILDK